MITKQQLKAKEKYENQTFVIGGQEVKIVKYIDWDNVLIQFPNKRIITVKLSCIKNDSIKDTMSPSVEGNGYLGMEDESSIDKNIKNIKHVKSYQIWSSMLQRVFSPTECAERGLKICDEWLNYQEFKRWFDLNYYDIDGYDIIITNKFFNYKEKLYSPETTMFLPRFITTLIKTESDLDRSIPRGIAYYPERRRPYAVFLTKYKRNTKYFGSYGTIEEAYTVYSIEKEKYIHECADILINDLPYKVYNILKNYTTKEN